jgi:hypothetical protein
LRRNVSTARRAVARGASASASRARLAVDRDRDDRAARAGEALVVPGQRAGVDQAAAADGDAVPVDGGDGAGAGDVLERRRGQVAARVGDDGAGQRVLALALDGGGVRQRALVADDLDDLGRAVGEGAGLVEDDGVDPGHGLDRGGVLEQHASPRPEPGPDHHGGGRREAEGVGAGDDDDRDGVEQRALRVAAHGQPDEERREPARERDEHEPRGGAVGEPLARRARRLRVADEPDDLRERAVAADARRADAQRAGAVDGRADDVAAGHLAHRQALAGHHRLVHVGLAVLDGAVDGDPRARTYEHEVARAHLRRRHLDGLAVPDHHGPRRGEVEQRADGVVRAAARPHLEPVAEQHERREHRRGLVEHLAAAGRRDAEGVREPGRDRDGDEHHHVQRPRAQRPGRPVEERPRRPPDDGQAQEELPHVVAQPERRRRPEPQHLAPDRRPQHDRQAEHRRHEEPAAHVPRHRRHVVPGVRVGRVPGVRAGRVPRVLRVRRVRLGRLPRVRRLARGGRGVVAVVLLRVARVRLHDVLLRRPS